MEDLKPLSDSELVKTNGGHDGTAYKIGKAVGNALEALSILIPAGKAVKSTKAL